MVDASADLIYGKSMLQFLFNKCVQVFVRQCIDTGKVIAGAELILSQLATALRFSFLMVTAIWHSAAVK